MADSLQFPWSGHTMADDTGAAYAGGVFRIYDAGTTDPRTVYSDKDVTTAAGTTIVCDADGIVPMRFLPVGDWKVTFETAAAVQIFSYDNLPGALDTSPFAPGTAQPEMPAISVTTAAYSVLTANVGKFHDCNPAGGDIVATLPSAVTAGDGALYVFRHVAASGVVTVIGQSGQLASPVTLTRQGQTYAVSSNGATWRMAWETRGIFANDVPFIEIVDRRETPPLSPAGGDLYIATGTPSGTWSSYSAGDVLEYNNSSGWIKHTPEPGWIAYVTDEELLTQYRGSAWVDLTNISAPSTSALKSAVFEDLKATNTQGGTPSAAQRWLTRTLNTQVSNTITGLSLSSNQLTGAAGTYMFDAEAPFYDTSYARLRLFHIKKSGTFTITIASPGVVTHTAHGLSNGDEWIPATTGALPTGITAGTSYYVVNATTDTHQVAATPGGAAINTSGSQSGTHTMTAGAALGISPNIYADPTANVDAFATVSGVFTMSAAWTAELQFLVQSAATNGLGNAHNYTGMSERYARLRILDLTATQGPQGTPGTAGADGVDGGIKWLFDNSTTMADPGSGDLRLNNATLANVTAIAISDNSAETGNPDTSAFVLTWDDSSSSVRGQLRLQKRGAAQNFAVYNITGASTDNSGWTQLAVTHVSSAGSFSNADTLILSFSRSGDKWTAPTQSMFIRAHQLRPRLTAGCAALTASEIGTQLVYQETLDFDQSTDEGAEIIFTMPTEWNGGTVTLTPYWTASSGTGNVVWAFQSRAYSDGDGYNGALSTAVTSTDAKGTNNTLMIGPDSSAMTISNVSGSHQMIVLRVTRDADNASDTLTADAKLIGVRINYTAS